MDVGRGEENSRGFIFKGREGGTTIITEETAVPWEKERFTHISGPVYFSQPFFLPTGHAQASRPKAASIRVNLETRHACYVLLGLV